MFFLAKLVGYFLHPFSWILILLAFTFFTRNKYKRKRLAGWTIAVVIFFSNSWIITNLVYHYEARPVELSPQQQYQAGIVLGGFMSYDESSKRAFFNQSSDRFIQTVRLYKLGHIQKIIVSGGNGSLRDNGFREADFIRKNLLDIGIPDSSILIEANSKNTIENGRFVKQLTDSIQYRDTSLLITSAFHMPRAMEIFTKTGLIVKPFPCSFIINAPHKAFNIGDIIPSFDAIGLWQVYLRELVGKLRA